MGDLSEPIFVHNAGLVLLAPYLQMLLDRLGLLIDNGSGPPRIVGIEPTSRAVRLLQYMADGRLDTPARDLSLNKLLCGIPPDAAVLPSLSPDPADLSVCDQLLQAVISNWPPMSNSSVASLRETYLQREGRLQHTGDQWILHVQRRGFDVLLDQIPWSISVIAGRWMPESLLIDW